MLTHEELAHIAARLLEVREVREFTLYDDPEHFGMRLICFEEYDPDHVWTREERETYLKTYLNRFVIIDARTGRGIVYIMGIDMQTDFPEACVNFVTGLQSQKYRLEIFDIQNWERVPQLLQGLKLDVKALDPPLSQTPKTTNWLYMDLNPVQEQYQQEGRLVFNDVDINGYYGTLFGGRYYHCFDFVLFAFDDATQRVGEKVVVQDEPWQDEFDNRYIEQDSDAFWEELYTGPLEDFSS